MERKSIYLQEPFYEEENLSFSTTDRGNLGILTPSPLPLAVYS